MERQEIRLKLAELDSQDWLDDEDTLTAQETALLNARLITYANDPDIGDSWQAVESRVQARLTKAWS